MAKKPARKQHTGPSNEARAFLDTYKAPIRDESAEALPGIRASSLAAAKSAATRVKRRLKLKTREIEIAGVPCLDITPPTIRDERTLLYLFGGGYVVGSPLEDLVISGTLAVYAEARVISPDYRLAPEHPYPAAVDDSFAVYKDLIESVPAGGLALAGESAGGGAALAIMQRARSQGIFLPSVCALLSPWCAIDEMGATVDLMLDPTFTEGHLETIANHYAGTHDRSLPELSPVNGTYDETFPPTIITTGTHDKFLSQVSRLARVMRENGIGVDLRVWEDMWHVFEWYDDLPEADASLIEIAAFLDDHFI